MADHVDAAEERTRERSRPLGLAVIGCGWAGRYAHLTPLRDRADARVIWTIDADVQRAVDVAGAFGAAHSGADLECVLADPEVDAVVVASPTALHAEHTIAALRAGKHVLVEKPMAASAAEAHAMVEAARGLVLMVAHCCRFMPAFVEARSLISNGRLGRLRHIQSRRNVLIREFKPWWNAERPGGFLLSWLGSHQIDVTRWLVGRTPARVYAEMGHGTPGLAGDDAFSVLMWFDGAGEYGPIASIDQCMSAQDREHDFLVVGSDATLRVRDYVHLSVDGVPIDLGAQYRPGEPQTSHASYPRQMEEFLCAIRDRRPASVSPTDALATMTVLDACYRAAATHTVQTLAPNGDF